MPPLPGICDGTYSALSTRDKTGDGIESLGRSETGRFHRRRLPWRLIERDLHPVRVLEARCAISPGRGDRWMYERGAVSLEATDGCVKVGHL